jgi:DNA-binding transcriptional ArsR family regulator
MSRLERGAGVAAAAGLGSDRLAAPVPHDCNVPARNGESARLPDDSNVVPRITPWPESQTATLCRLLSLLADKTRRRILQLLAGGELPVISLTRALRVPQPTVSHHLAWLRMMDLVYSRRQGKHIFYALGPAAACDETGGMTLSAEGWTVTIRPHDPVP